MRVSPPRLPHRPARFSGAGDRAPAYWPVPTAESNGPVWPGAGRSCCGLARTSGTMGVAAAPCGPRGLLPESLAGRISTRGPPGAQASGPCQMASERGRAVAPRPGRQLSGPRPARTQSAPAPESGLHELGGQSAALQELCRVESLPGPLSGNGLSSGSGGAWHNKQAGFGLNLSLITEPPWSRETKHMSTPRSPAPVVSGLPVLLL